MSDKQTRVMRYVDPEARQYFVVEYNAEGVWYPVTHTLTKHPVKHYVYSDAINAESKLLTNIGHRETPLQPPCYEVLMRRSVYRVVLWYSPSTGKHLYMVQWYEKTNRWISWLPFCVGGRWVTRVAEDSKESAFERVNSAIYGFGKELK